MTVRTNQCLFATVVFGRLEKAGWTFFPNKLFSNSLCSFCLENYFLPQISRGLKSCGDVLLAVWISQSTPEALWCVCVGGGEGGNYCIDLSIYGHWIASALRMALMCHHQPCMWLHCSQFGSANVHVQSGIHGSALQHLLFNGCCIGGSLVGDHSTMGARPLGNDLPFLFLYIKWVRCPGCDGWHCWPQGVLVVIRRRSSIWILLKVYGFWSVYFKKKHSEVFLSPFFLERKIICIFYSIAKGCLHLFLWRIFVHPSSSQWRYKEFSCKCLYENLLVYSQLVVADYKRYGN